jgi:hypothetical protein
MSERQPYSRLYWSVFDDERFATIRGDMRHFGAWSCMLLVADMAYPASAFVPPVVSRASLAALVDAGLIEPQLGGLFRVHGLQAERERRADAARRGGSRDQDGTQTGGERVSSLAKPRRDEPSQANGEAADALDDYYRLTLRYPSGRTKDWLDELANEFGHRETGQALGAEYGASKEVKTILSRTEARLRSEAHHAERERLKPKPRKPEETPAEKAEYEAQKRALIIEMMRPVEGQS